MSTIDIKDRLGVAFATLGILPERAAYCVPFLTGEKAIPTATEKAVEDAAARCANVRTVTLVKAAEIAGVSRSTIWRMTKDGTIPTVCIRGKNRVHVSDVEKAFSVNDGKGVAK